MIDIAAIAYTRGKVLCGFIRLGDYTRATQQDRMQMIYRPEVLNAHSYDVWDHNADVGKIVKSAVDWVFAQGASPARWVVTGYGPFNFTNGGQKKLGSVREVADPPFNGCPILNLVAGRIRKRTDQEHSVELITDVAAMATDEYWRTWYYRNPQHPHVVAAMIIGTGIGGAFVQKPGAIVGQNYHTELGHVPVSRRPDDPLEYSGCRLHKNCATAFASLEALGLRAKSMGIEPSDVFDTDNRLLWELEANYVAQLCLTTILMIAPTRIVLGGSVAENRVDFLELVRDELAKNLGKFIDYPALHDLGSLLGEIDRDRSMLRGAIQHANYHLITNIAEHPAKHGKTKST